MKKAFLFLLSTGTLLLNNIQTKAQNDTSKVVADTTTRLPPSPIPSPPFPGSEWVGAIVVGGPNDETIYPLQKLLGWVKNKSKIRIYGWVEAGGDLSTSKNSNAPAAYDLVPNAVEINQAIFRIEREPNTVQTSKVDWGFMIDNLYGTDYRYTIAKGLFSDQLLKHNNLYGYDPAQFFALLYIPKVAEGMTIKVGRFISPSDIEAQWAGDNYLFSHSLMYAVDPFTYTGFMVNIRFSKYFQLEFGAHGGNDVVPWNNSANLNGMIMARWVAKNNNNALYGGIPSVGKGYYTNQHDNLQMAVTTWGHRFSDKVHMMTEMYYMWQKDAAVGGTVITGPAESYFMQTGQGPRITGTCSAVGLVNFFEIALSQKNYLSIRNDFLNDPQGNRTGYATAYTSHTLGFAHHFSSFLTVRPEARYETAYANGITPYDNGSKKNQFTLAADVFVRF